MEYSSLSYFFFGTFRDLTVIVDAMVHYPDLLFRTTFTMVKWNGILVGTILEAFERFKGRRNYKDLRVGWLPVGTTRKLEEDEERLTMIHHQFKREDQRPSSGVYTDTCLSCR